MSPILSAYVWMLSNFAMIAAYALIYTLRKRKVLTLVKIFFHLCCAAWGATAPDINVRIISEVNMVWLPFVGGVFLSIACVLLLNEFFKRIK